MILLAGLVVAGQIQKLGAVQANPVGAALQTADRFVRKLDVGIQANPDSVGGLGRQVTQLRQSLAQRLTILQTFLVTGQGLLVRIDNHSAAIAVDDHPISRVNRIQERSDANDRRQFQSLGDDRSMAARPSRFGAKTLHVTAIQVRRFAGRQHMGEHNHRFGQVRQWLTVDRSQFQQQLFLNVPNILGALSQQWIVQPSQRGGIAMQNSIDRISGGLPLAANAPTQLGMHMRIVQHLLLRLEDVPCVVPGGCGGLYALVFQTLRNRLDRSAQR